MGEGRDRMCRVCNTTSGQVKTFNVPIPQVFPTRPRLVSLVACFEGGHAHQPPGVEQSARDVAFLQREPSVGLATTEAVRSLRLVLAGCGLCGLWWTVDCGLWPIACGLSPPVPSLRHSIHYSFTPPPLSSEVLLNERCSCTHTSVRFL